MTGSRRQKEKGKKSDGKFEAHASSRGDGSNLESMKAGRETEEIEAGRWEMGVNQNAETPFGVPSSDGSVLAATPSRLKVELRAGWSTRKGTLGRRLRGRLGVSLQGGETHSG